MARYTRLQVYNAIHEIGVIPVFYNADLDNVKSIVKACSSGGIRVLEFTNRGDHAWEVFTELEKWARVDVPDAILGAGSVLEPATAAMYINSGANFIVGPVTNAEVARTCNRRKIGYTPGCGTASEVSYAEELGCEIIKVFPETSAEAAGLREDDLIIAIDGTPVYERGCGDPEGDPAGQPQVWSYIRDGLRAEAEIETEILVP